MVANGATGSRDKNDALYPRVVAGDLAACRQMIQSNMSLVIHKVDTYIHIYPDLAYLRDDLISEGFVGLVYAVNKKMCGKPMEGDKQPNATGYMSYWIQYHIGLVADKETSLGSSTKTVRRKRTDGDALPKHVALPKNLETETYDDPAIRVFELRDEILGCCETDDDRMIVEMREKGYVDGDIAKALNLPYTTVYLMRRDIYRRFLTKTGMKGEV
jgi:hypothetical protein